MIRIALTLLLLSPLVAEAAPPARKILYIQPLGRTLPKVDTELVKTALSEFYGLDVRVLPVVALPKAAWYAPRKRYRAEKLLDFLQSRLPKDGYRILGLTAVDISTTKGKHKDWGILGLATLDGRVCVISKYRCRRRARGARHARVRLAKVAVHEIGHTLGLDHCPTRGCLMEDARGSVLTTDREKDVCPRCRRLLEGHGRKIPPTPEPLPWT